MLRNYLFANFIANYCAFGCDTAVSSLRYVPEKISFKPSTKHLSFDFVKILK